LKFILPEYDESRVYVSDIKKLVTWYNLLSKNNEELFVAEAKSEISEKNDDEDAAEETS